MKRAAADRRVALLLAAAWLLPARARAQRGAGSEYEIKAAFVCKFAGYVEWPPGAFERPDSPLVIGVLAMPSVAADVERAAEGLTIDLRPLAVRRLKSGEPLQGVHVLYVARSHAAQLPAVLAAAQRLPVLTVTEQPDEVAPTGAINFVVVDNRVRFDVAPHVAEAGDLRVSSRILGVARRVVPRAS